MSDKSNKDEELENIVAEFPPQFQMQLGLDQANIRMESTIGQIFTQSPKTGELQRVGILKGYRPCFPEESARGEK